MTKGTPASNITSSIRYLKLENGSLVAGPPGSTHAFSPVGNFGGLTFFVSGQPSWFYRLTQRLVFGFKYAELTTGELT